MTAKKMRNILFAALGLVIVLTGALIYFATDLLRSTTSETIHRQIDAEISAEDLNRLQSLEVFLSNNQPVVKKAQQIVSDSKQYQYQDQIVKDLNSYAASSGISINGYDFGIVNNDPKQKSKTSKSKKNTKTISGVKSIPVTISLDSPMQYSNFLKFLKLLEQNISKMQVAGISLTPDEDNARLVINPSVSLIVYVR